MTPTTNRTAGLDHAQRAISSQALARALCSLLDRDRDRPARWLHPGFAAEVARERGRLHRVVRIRDLGVPPGSRDSFADLAQCLGRDPVAVAVAVRHLEIARESALPSWDVLVRHGLPGAASALEAATWFG